MSHDCFQTFVQLLLRLLHLFRDGVAEAKCIPRRPFQPPGQELIADGAIHPEPHGADAGQLCPAGGPDHILSVFVLHRHLISIMAVSVKKHIDPGCIGNHLIIAPRRSRILIAEMRHGDNIPGTFFSRLIDCLLNLCVELFSRLVLAEIIHKVSGVILEISRCGRGDGLRRCDTDKRKLDSVKFLDDIRIKDQFSILIEIAADVRELCFLCQRQELIHPIVEFMIAWDGNVIACRIHQLQRCLSLRHCPDRFALDEIPVIHKQRIAPLVFIILPDLVQPVKAKILIHPAVDIARKQNHQILRQSALRFSLRCCRRNRRQKYHKHK